MSNILIVEDDKAISIEFSKLVEKFGWTVSATARSSSEALRLIEKNNPDLILLDIAIKGRLKAIEFALKIQHLKIPILFLLKPKKKYDLESVSRSSQFKFIEKTATPMEIKLACDRLFSITGISDSKKETLPSYRSIIYKKRDNLYRVSIDDILYIKGADDYTITITADQEYVSSFRLFKMEDKLLKFGFFKSHRSFLVNLDQVEGVNPKKTHLLIKEHQIPISRNNKSAVLELCNKTTL